MPLQSSAEPAVPQATASPQAEASPQAQPRPPATNRDFPAYQFVAGKSSVYRLKYQSDSKADLRVLFEGQNAGQAQSSGLNYTLSATLQGKVAVTTTRAGSDRVENFYIFQSPIVHLVVNGNDQTAQANEVAATLAQGFLVELNLEGKVTALYLPTQAGKFSQDFARTLLAALQFVLPESASADTATWTTTEADRNGPYTARYRVVKSANATTGELVIRKSKLRYLPASANLTGENLPGKTDARKKVTPKMDFEAQFDTSTGQLASLSGKEILDTAVEDKNIAHSETTVLLTRTNEPRLPASALNQVNHTAAALKENSERLVLFAQKSRTEIEGNIQRTELGSATLADLMTQLNAIDDDLAGPDKQQAIETPVYLKFKALVYVHPESCAQLGQTLASAKISSPTFRILSGALGAVGHRQAQAALVQAINARPQDPDGVSTLIATLGGAPHPTPESEKGLREIAATAADPNVSGAAVLALGSMARSLATSEPGRSSAIVDFLLQRSDASVAMEQKQAAVQALGNSASSRALPVITKLANDASPAIRAAAVDALRNIPQPEVDPLLRHALSADTEPQVGLEAAFALGFRKTSLASFTAQKKALATETDDKVRGAILDNLARMHKQFPEVRGILAHSAKDDPSEYVRKESAGLLGSLPAKAASHK